ncbi:hypothetical protein MIT9_P1905 [Methylomarinovum caldicuralii]|uniref:DnaJ homologue subfamily C member 28 conserved domain-containing protein n=1 Tax=Methylomarinovum caldicuralii TaxID=438856 RepID=A0AAU9C8F8_9GAMM|nr:DUF1992 domain-containing protein [Methylomarinovum caldicuralii]BCX82319.1 hypothetical protein MIT9_P1905 [Methylomarinovum caldicuralii]
MRFWDRLAEERIQEAMAQGAFDDLPGAGKPLPEDDLPGVPPELRMAYRILKNAGYVPEEVQLRREIADVHRLLAEGLASESLATDARRRLKLLLQRLGELRGGNLLLQERYLQALAERLGNEGER